MSHAARPVVLVAEDDASVRMTLEFVLIDEGFDVVLAEDGAAALHLASERRPDVILLDKVMPKLDGKEVFARLRSDPRLADVPVLVLTGMSRERADEWPGARFVGKPFSPDELLRAIRAVLDT